MPGIVGRIGGDLSHDSEAVLQKLRHFPFYEHKTVDTEKGWLGWCGVGQAESHAGLSAGMHRPVAYHGDGVVCADAASAQRHLDIVAEHAAESPMRVAEDLDGSFSAAVYDPQSGELVCITDIFGHYRLYYIHVGDTLYFASELKAFFGWPQLDLQLNTDALRDLYNYTYPLGELTSLKNVHLLPPASCLRFRDGQLRVSSYWSPEYRPVEADEDDLTARGHELFRENFARKAPAGCRLIVPVSGGLDSRMLLAEAIDRGHDIKTYTFGHARSREAKVAMNIMDAMGTGSRFISLDDFPEPEANFQRASWFGEGMINLSVSNLCAVQGYLINEPRDAIFVNGIYGGPTNFSSIYHKPRDLVSDLPLEERVRRTGVSIFSGYLHTESNYRVLQPDFAKQCREGYYAQLSRRFEASQSASADYGHQKDSFLIAQRLFRFMNQVDLNRYYWNETFPLTSTGLYLNYLQLPDSVKFDRRLHRLIIAKYYPDAAGLENFNTGRNVFEDLDGAPPVVRGQTLKKLLYYAGRLSRGRINVANPESYLAPGYYYRRNRRIRRFMENLLGDETLVTGDVFRPDVIKEYLVKSRHGSDVVTSMYQIAAWELWARQLRSRSMEI
jgi:Glutamine amidotransferase domain